MKRDQETYIRYLEAIIRDIQDNHFKPRMDLYCFCCYEKLFGGRKKRSAFRALVDGLVIGIVLLFFLAGVLILLALYL